MMLNDGTTKHVVASNNKLKTFAVIIKNKKYGLLDVDDKNAGTVVVPLC